MKYITIKILNFTALVAVIFFSSCTKDSGEIFNTTVIGLEENGLTKDINNLVPDTILQEMLNMGMPINTGDSPPNLVGKYFTSPLNLVTSNISSDYVGQGFDDYTWTLYDQSFERLTINVDYDSNNDKSAGSGSYVVGNRESFSIFVEALGENSLKEKYKLVYVLSGNLIGDDIHDFHLALFMIDNFGNPSGSFIENGQGRVVIDSDTVSEKI